MVRRPVLITLLLTLAALCAPRGALAATDLEVVAATGVAHGWLPDGVLLDVTVPLDVTKPSKGNLLPIANHTGWIAFSADLKGDAVALDLNDQALFRRAPDGTVTLLARRGDQAPGAPEGVVWHSFTPTCLAADGTLFGRAHFDFVNGNGGVTNENDLVATRITPDGTITLLAREGDVVPDLPAYTFTPIPGETSPPVFFPHCTAAGEAFFVHPITKQDIQEYALFHVDADGSVAALHRTGEPAPGLAGKEEFAAFVRSPHVNAAGQTAFRAVIQAGSGGEPVGPDNYTAFFAPGTDGDLTLAMRQGDAAPGTPDGIFEAVSVFQPTTIAADGTIAFIQAFKHDNWYIDTGLWRHDPANPGVLEPLMVQNTPAPGLEPGWVTGYLNAVTGNADGRIAVVGEASLLDELGDPLLAEDAIWLQDDQGTLQTVALTGETAPGTDGATFQVFNVALLMNASGQMTFTGTLKPLPPVDSTNNFGVWLHTPGEGTFLFLRESTPITVAPDDQRTVSTITQPTTFQAGSGGADGFPIGLTDDGKGLFKVNFYGEPPVEGIETNAAIVVATLLPDPCDPEFVDCDDADACTNDTCDPEIGCVNTPIDCDDLDECTTDSCDAESGCQYEPVDCDDADACTTDSCDVEAGCQYEAVACDDADACTEDTCDAELGCQHEPVDCDDADVCTTDSCDVEAGCQHEAIPCDDADACTADACDAELGCQFAPVDCDDADACTTDSCDAELGCQHQTIDCDDTNPCTDDSCAPASGCIYADAVCDDADACTIDSCDPDTGCVFTDMTCDDQNPCTIDTCEAGSCVFTKDPAQPDCCVKDNDCHDGNLCTTDTCVDQLCQHADIDNCCITDKDCSDGDLCTIDLCDQTAGQCTFEPMDGCCTSDDDCSDGTICLDYQCGNEWCLACESQEDCVQDDTICASLASGMYCLQTCGGNCPEGYTCTDQVCVPEQGDCKCAKSPAVYGCDGADYVRFDTCGQVIEVLETCQDACADDDGCCAPGEFVQAGMCVNSPAPDADDADIVTPDTTEPIEEIIEQPDTTPEEDLPAPDTTQPDLATDDSIPGDATVESEEPSSGNGGCSTNGSNPTAALLLLALLALLAATRRIRAALQPFA